MDSLSKFTLGDGTKLNPDELKRLIAFFEALPVMQDETKKEAIRIDPRHNNEPVLTFKAQTRNQLRAEICKAIRGAGK